MNNQNVTLVTLPLEDWNRISNTITMIYNKLSIDTNVSEESEWVGVKTFLKKFSMCRSQFEKLKRDGTIPTSKIKGKVYVNVKKANEIFHNAKM